MTTTAGPELDTLFRDHYGRVARVIGRLIRDQARAEELAVEVFLKLNQMPESKREHAEGWLYRTAVRQAVDDWRRQSRRAKFERLFASMLGKPPTPEQLYHAASDQQNVRAVLAALSPRSATVLLLWAEGSSYRDIAAAAEVNPNYVGSLVSRAQSEFRKEFVKRYGIQ